MRHIYKWHEHTATTSNVPLPYMLGTIVSTAISSLMTSVRQERSIGGCENKRGETGGREGRRCMRKQCRPRFLVQVKDQGRFVQGIEQYRVTHVGRSSPKVSQWRTTMAIRVRRLCGCARSRDHRSDNDRVEPSCFAATPSMFAKIQVASALPCIATL
jgi:hypothetical protein